MCIRSRERIVGAHSHVRTYACTHAYAHDDLELSARRNYARIFDGQAPAIQFLLSRNIQFRLRYIIAFGASAHSGITRFDALEIITKRLFGGHQDLPRGK